MLIIRALVMLLLLTSVVLFALYILTGDKRYRRIGLVVLKWTVSAGLIFFVLLILSRLL